MGTRAGGLSLLPDRGFVRLKYISNVQCTVLHLSNGVACGTSDITPTVRYTQLFKQKFCVLDSETLPKPITPLNRRSQGGRGSWREKCKSCTKKLSSRAIFFAVRRVNY